MYTIDVHTVCFPEILGIGFYASVLFAENIKWTAFFHPMNLCHLSEEKKCRLIYDFGIENRFQFSQNIDLADGTLLFPVWMLFF